MKIRTRMMIVSIMCGLPARQPAHVSLGSSR
jgi:hypothetical protein